MQPSKHFSFSPPPTHIYAPLLYTLCLHFLLMCEVQSGLGLSSAILTSPLPAEKTMHIIIIIIIIIDNIIIIIISSTNEFTSREKFLPANKLCLFMSEWHSCFQEFIICCTCFNWKIDWTYYLIWCHFYFVALGWEKKGLDCILVLLFHLCCFDSSSLPLASSHFLLLSYLHKCSFTSVPFFFAFYSFIHSFIFCLFSFNFFIPFI